MYNSFRQFCERLLRIPHDPEPPPGDESSTRIFRAAPNYYKYLLCLWALRSLGTVLILLIAIGLPLGGAAFALVQQGRTWGYLLILVPVAALGLGVLVCLFSLAVLRLDFEKRWYVVTDRSLRIREGVVSIREMTVNFANIQNISISQGPLQRVLGLADLRVDTAGGGGGHDERRGMTNLHTAWFRGIDNAAEVRQLIQDRLGRLRDSGLGDPEEAARTLATVTPTTAVSPALLRSLREVHHEAQSLRQAIITFVQPV